MKPGSCILVLGAILLAGCASTAPIHPTRNIPPVVTCPPAGCGEALEVSYYGAGGFLVRYGDQAVLTGGMISNPRFARVAWWWADVAPDTAAIDAMIRQLPAAAPRDPARPALHDVRAILVGHSHYDHLMDVPYIARRHAPSATIFGSASTARLARYGAGPGNALVAIPHDSAGTAERAGRTYTAGRVRLMALRSSHGPNFRKWPITYTYATGDAPEDSPPPRTGRDWRGGETYAYLIDFLRPDGSIAFRVHYQDAASRAPLGFPPRSVLAERAVDVAIVSAGAATLVEHYPDAVLTELRPRHVVVGHWEDFFSRRAPPGAVKSGDMNELVRRIDRALLPGVGWSSPLPGATLRVYATPQTGTPASHFNEE